MPTIPTVRDLGALRINGKANPAEINPSVAYDIGRAGAAYAHAFQQIAAAFSGLGEKQAAMEDANWLADAKIASLTADDQIRRDTELNAGPDGTGFEQAPIRLDQSVKEIEQKPGGSAEARSRFKLWSAEQHFQTGRWAADTAQKRLKDHTGDTLDKRLDEMSNLSSNNPDKSMEYFSAYKEEVESRVGSAITAQDGATRVEQARTQILKAATIAKAIKNPADFGKALSAIRGGQAAFEAENPETRARPTLTPRSGGAEPASVSFELETGKKDPLKGVGSINTNDSAGTHSYGNFGINSGGSAQQFAAKYGEKFGLTAKPGTAEFDKQWRNAAGAMPVELHAAELDWWDDTIGSKVTNNLVRAGVTSDVAADPRVVAYFADRSVQQGPGAIANHASRVQAAFKAAKGDVPAFLAAMSKTDKANLKSDFPTALATGAYSEAGNETRVSGRERLSLAVGGGAARPQPEARTEADRGTLDIAKVGTVDGTIQPQELLSLSPRDYHSVVKEVGPHLETLTVERMDKAMSALSSKGSQSIIAPHELDDMTPILGPKKVAAFKEALRSGEEQYTVNDAVKKMTPAERSGQLAALVPTGRVEDLSEVETRRFEMWSKAINHVKTRMKDDPMTYLATENEGGKQAAKLIAGAAPNKDGTAQREQAYDTFIKLQKQEGVPASKVRILGKETAQSMATALKDAKSGPAALQIIEGARETYGKHFNQVWGEMADAGAPQTYLALTTATRQGQNAIIDSFAMEKAMQDGATKAEGRRDQMITRAGVKVANLQKEITTQMSGFTQALEGGTSSPQLAEAYRDAVERVALKHMVDGESNLSKAVTQATKDIFKDNVEVYRGVLVPREDWDRDGNKISRGMTPGNIGGLIEANKEMIISTPVAGKQFGKDFAQSHYVDSLKGNHKLITNEEMTGVYVLDQLGRYVMVDSEEGRKPLFFDWGTLSGSAKLYRYNY